MTTDPTMHRRLFLDYFQGQVQMLVNTLNPGRNPPQAVVAAGFRVAMTTGEMQYGRENPEQAASEPAAGFDALGDPTTFEGAARMVRIDCGQAGVGPCRETRVDHRVDALALGW